MADQVGIDSEKQAAATTHVVESGDAVTSSAQGSSSLGAAQKSMFWGTEDGPKSMGRSSAELFDTVSDILAKEAELISTFEAEINAALKDFTGTEQDYLTCSAPQPFGDDAFDGYQFNGYRQFGTHHDIRSTQVLRDFEREGFYSWCHHLCTSALRSSCRPPAPIETWTRGTSTTPRL